MTERYYAAGLRERREGDPVTLDGHEAHHLARVMRVPVGASVRVFGDGREFEAVVEQLRPHVELRLIREREGSGAAGIALTVAIPWLRGGRSDYIVQKLTELGVREIVLYEAQRAVAHGVPAKLPRLERLAVESCKQCERRDVPQLAMCASFAEALDRLYARMPVVVLAERSGGLRFSAVAKMLLGDDPARPVSAALGIVSGPEGGFAPEEIDAARERAALAWLGPRILRADFAPIAAMVAALCVAGEL
jgi:16S rRNA (uracil1498-N3)-methyltransferase